MKLWWVHCEAMIATLMAHQASGRSAFWEQFKKVMHFTFENVRFSTECEINEVVIATTPVTRNGPIQVIQAPL